MSTAHVLLIEPDQLLQDAYRKQLSLDFEVSCTKTAQGAIDILDTTPIDLVITDVLLGSNNGIELVAEMRSYDDWLEIPIILLSSLPISQFPTSTSVWERYGVEHFLYKARSSPAQISNTALRVLRPHIVV